MPSLPLGSPWVSTGPGPRGRATRLRSAPCLPASSEQLPAVCTQQTPYVSSARPRLLPPEGSSGVLGKNGLQSRGPLRPPLAHAHAPLLAQVAAPEGPCCSRRGPGRLGLAGREEVQRDPGWCLAYSAPPTRAPRQMELASAMGLLHLLEALSSPERDSLVFPAP